MKKLLREESRLWDYQIERQLGHGSYGHVYLVKSKKNNQYYALKKINVANCHDREKLQIYREIQALRVIDHPNIIKYFESFISLDHVYIVMEYAAGGDLMKSLKERQRKGRTFSEQEIWKIATQVLAGLKHLHDKQIVHRDIKLENLFISSQGNVKIGDLGLCKVLMPGKVGFTTRVGTPIYFAPEMIRNQVYSYPVDVWALGCCLYTLAALDHPFSQASIQTLPHFVLDNQIKPIKANCSSGLINFIFTCLEKQYNSRPCVFDLAVRARQKGNRHVSNKISIFDFKKFELLVDQPAQSYDQQSARQYKSPIRRLLAYQKSTVNPQQKEKPKTKAMCYSFHCIPSQKKNIITSKTNSSTSFSPVKNAGFQLNLIQSKGSNHQFVKFYPKTARNFYK